MAMLDVFQNKLRLIVRLQAKRESVYRTNLRSPSSRYSTQGTARALAFIYLFFFGGGGIVPWPPLGNGTKNKTPYAVS